MQARIVTREASLEGKPNSAIALSLAKMAIRNGSKDDVSAYVLTLDDRWQGSAENADVSTADKYVLSNSSAALSPAQSEQEMAPVTPVKRVSAGYTDNALLPTAPSTAVAHSTLMSGACFLRIFCLLPHLAI